MRLQTGALGFELASIEDKTTQKNPPSASKLIAPVVERIFQREASSLRPVRQQT